MFCFKAFYRIIQLHVETNDNINVYVWGRVKGGVSSFWSACEREGRINEMRGHVTFTVMRKLQLPPCYIKFNNDPSLGLVKKNINPLNV